MGLSHRDVTTPGSRHRLPLTAVVGAILLAGFMLLMLVLTGIIAEPETVIEHIGRALFGG